ncbi:MAG: 2-dehydropantoate 2-reductase [Proteobacteria bacterium]|nr:2-dehydropantoate 2-reductase [Pseudomonadota bacterium]
MSRISIGVFGAGAIGTYVGVRLSAAGYPVTLVGRPALVHAAGQLRAVDLDGTEIRPNSDIAVVTDAGALASCQICLVTVKSGDSQRAGAALAPVLDGDATVISLQNGLGNVERLRRGGLPQAALAGLVTFNVRRVATARFVKATDGPIMIEGASAPCAVEARDALAATGEPVLLRDDLLAVQATKLLLNLNNGLCAVTGLPIRESIRSRDLRWCFSACIREGMSVMRAAGLQLARIGRLSPPLIARLLLLPNVAFERLAGSFMRIDPAARSSTLQDLDVGKQTEIDFLNGAIVLLGQQVGVATPANQFVVDQVHRLEASEKRPLPFLSPAMVRASMTRAG